MTLLRSPFTLWIPLLVALGTLALWRPQLWSVPVALGVILIAAAFMPTRKNFENPAAGGGLMKLPNTWNENQIASDVMRYQSEGGLLGQYIDGVVQRFVAGQQGQTLEARTKFLESFNRYAEVSRVAYKWQAYMTSGRAQMEEEIELLKVKIDKKKLEAQLGESEDKDPELTALQRRVAVLDLELRIAQSQKAIADVNRQPPEPPTPLSARERRDMQRNSFLRREKAVRAEIAATEADTELPEDVRQRKLNALEEKLNEILDELVALL